MFDDISKLSLLFQKYNAKNILCFCGKKSFEDIKSKINFNSFNVDFYNDFSNNPKDEEVKLAYDKLDKNYDLIVAIGGGSVIDFAKVYKYYLYKNTNQIIPLIAAPTTAGTGSEVTSFAVVYIDNVKHSLEDKILLPNDFLIDYKLLYNLSKYQKACTAFDAFAQAIESFWSVNANKTSKDYAKNALMLCRDNLVDYVNQTNEINAKAMAKASNYAGMAINITKTTLPHALSYKFTSDYNLPHGHAVALSLPKVFFYHLDANHTNDTRGLEYHKNMMSELCEILDIKDISYFTNMLEKIGLEYHLDKLDIKNIDIIIKSVNTQRLKNNPVSPSYDDTLRVFFK